MDEKIIVFQGLQIVDADTVASKDLFKGEALFFARLL